MPTPLPFGSAPFTAAMAAEGGITRNMLRRLIRCGLVHQVLRGVYVSHEIPDSLELRANAAALVMPPHSVVCDRSAAWLHGVDILEYAELDLPPDLDVAAAGQRKSRRTGVFGAERDLSPLEITTVGGVQVTTPARTACDIACLRGRRRALATLDAFRRQFGLTKADLNALLPRFTGRRGVIQLRELVGLSTYLADSPPESWMRLMIHDFGLPTPEPQVTTYVPGWGPVRIENAYEHLRVGAEYDGEEFHNEDHDQGHDRERRAALRDNLGWHIVVVRKDGLSNRRAEEWLRELRSVVEARKVEQPTKRIYSRAPDEPNRYRRLKRT